MKLFATAANPADIPELAPGHTPWYGAAPYATGYPWPQDQLRRFPHRFSLIQQPDPMPYVKRARGIDVEAFAVEDQFVRSFLIRRQDLFSDATMYCSESTFNGLWDRGIINDLEYRLYAALWDDDPFTQPEWHGKKAWAKQYMSLIGYEVSNLYAATMNSPL